MLQGAASCTRAHGAAPALMQPTTRMEGHTTHRPHAQGAACCHARLKGLTLLPPATALPTDIGTRTHAPWMPRCRYGMCCAPGRLPLHCCCHDRLQMCCKQSPCKQGTSRLLLESSWTQGPAAATAATARRALLASGCCKPIPVLGTKQLCCCAPQWVQACCSCCWLLLAGRHTPTAGWCASSQQDTATAAADSAAAHHHQTSGPPVSSAALLLWMVTMLRSLLLPAAMYGCCCRCRCSGGELLTPPSRCTRTGWPWPGRAAAGRSGARARRVPSWGARRGTPRQRRPRWTPGRRPGPGGTETAGMQQQGCQ